MRLVCFIEGKKKEVEVGEKEFEKVRDLLEFVNEHSVDVVIYRVG